MWTHRTDIVFIHIYTTWLTGTSELHHRMSLWSAYCNAQESHQRVIDNYWRPECRQRSCREWYDSFYTGSLCIYDHVQARLVRCQERRRRCWRICRTWCWERFSRTRIRQTWVERIRIWGRLTWRAWTTREENLSYRRGAYEVDRHSDVDLHNLRRVHNRPVGSITLWMKATWTSYW